MEFKIFTNFDESINIWKNMERYSHYYFSNHNWLNHWINTIGKLKNISQLAIIYAKEDSDEVLLPLYISNDHGIKILKFLGDEISDYHAPIFSCSDEFAKKVYNFILNEKSLNYDILFFEKQPENVYDKKNPFYEIGTSLHTELSHHLCLKEDFDSVYEEKVRTKTRADTRRQTKRLSEFGEIKFVTANDLTEKKNIVNTMIEQKTFRYLNSGVKNIFAFDEYKEFYKSISLDDNNIHVSALYLNDKIIATHWGVATNKHFYLLMPTYDYDWMKYSSGRIHLKYLVEWACKNNYNIFDFTIGDESYKKEWCDKVLMLKTNYAVKSFKGYIFIVFKKLENKLRENESVHLFMRKLKRLREKI